MTVIELITLLLPLHPDAEVQMSDGEPLVKIEYDKDSKVVYLEDI